MIEDPWLPSTQNPYIQTNNEALWNRKVSSLMDTSTGTWNTDLVLDIFDEMDANSILSIPISIEDNDMWYWRKEKMESYSVKSAYQLLQENELLNRSSNNSGFWRCLWNLKIPPKVKNFVASVFVLFTNKIFTSDEENFSQCVLSSVQLKPLKKLCIF